MKYIIVRCEDGAWLGPRTPALLESANPSHLQHLAQAGAVGRIRRPGKQTGIDRFHLHRAMFGLGPHDMEATPAQCYAASANLQLAPGETAWCADFMTRRDDRIIDPTAGNILTKESEVLIHALNERFGSDTQRWEVGQGSHHLLVVSESPLGLNGRWSGQPPELLAGQPWKSSLPKGELGQALQSLIEEVSQFLEQHAINRVRIDLGENPANAVWLWGATDTTPHRTFTQRTGLSGAIVSSRFPLRGLARTLGLDWKMGPTSFEERPLRHLTKTISEFVGTHDLVYAHLRVDSADPVERLCAIERIDHVLLKPLTEMLPQRGSWRLLAAVDDHVQGTVSLIAIGSGLPQHPAAQLNAEHFAESPLVFDDGLALFSWLTKE